MATYTWKFFKLFLDAVTDFFVEMFVHSIALLIVDMQIYF